MATKCRQCDTWWPTTHSRNVHRTRMHKGWVDGRKRISIPTPKLLAMKIPAPAKIGDMLEARVAAINEAYSALRAARSALAVALNVK